MPEPLLGGALLTGLAAGLAVAIPLGAIGVLLLHEGLTRGARSAAAGAAGVAVVDTVYATLAVLGGAAVASALGGREVVVRAVGGAVLGMVAVVGIVRTLRAAPVGAVGTGAGVLPGQARPAATFLRFVALTAVNPLTALAFVAVAAGLASRWPTAIGAVAFVVGVGLASLTWQLALAGAGGLLGRWSRTRARTGQGVRRVLGLCGFGLVAVLAVVVAIG
ncbi:MAG: LysE family transporter [Cellulomonas sp.]